MALELDLESTKDRIKNRLTSKMWFAKGNPVEVTSDEEGFSGAWFTAKILKSPSPSSAKFKKGKALVEYEALLANDEKSPLQEFVDTSFIRPLPPPVEDSMTLQSFEIFDVVDAFYRDGWWKGVVIKVREVFDAEDNKSERRYTVVFEKPPDQIDFVASSLRFHLEWNGDSWVRPEKQTRMEGLKFSRGMDVLVNLDDGSPCLDWFPAVVLEEVGFNSFLVKLINSSSEDESGHVELIVDCFHIRPPFPNLESQNFELLEQVYAFDYSVWRLGFVNKILTEGRHTVLLKHSREEKAFHRSEIRPLMDFMYGNWVTNYKVPGDFANGKELSVHAKSVENPRVTVRLRYSGAAKGSMEEETPLKNSRNIVRKQSPYNITWKSGRIREETPLRRVPMLSCTSRKSRRQNSTSPSSSQSFQVRSISDEKTDQEAEASISTLPSAKSESSARVKIAGTNVEEAAVRNEMMLSVEEGEMPLNSLFKRQRVPRKGSEKENSQGYSSEGVSVVEHITNEVKSPAPLPDGMKGSFSDEYARHELAAQIESHSASKGDTEENSPHDNLGKNLMQQSATHSASSVKTGAKKKARRKEKEISLNSISSFSPPSKKLRVRQSSNTSSFLEGGVKSMFAETTDQGAEITLAAQTKRSARHVADNQPSSEYEGPLRQKDDVTNQSETRAEDEVMIAVEQGVLSHSQAKSQLAQTEDILREETNRREIDVEDEMIISKKDGDISTHSQAQFDLNAGDGNDYSKEDSSLAEGMRSPDAKKSYKVFHEDINLLGANDGKQQRGVMSTETNMGEDDPSSNLDNAHNVAGDGVSDMVFENSTTRSTKMPARDVGPTGPLNEPTVLSTDHVGKEVIVQSITDSQPLCTQGNNCGETTNGMREMQEETVTEYSLVNASIDGEQVEYGLMPFVKNSPIWEMVEALEVFQRMPQKPHFQPLVSCKELEREGCAIGKMIYFATLVEKTSKLQVDDPRPIYDNYLEAFAELKSYGFDVEPVVYRINELWSIRESRAVLHNESKDVETKIEEHACERTKLEEYINELERKIRELEEQRALALSMKERKDSEITDLQERANGIGADISRTDFDFERVANWDGLLDYCAKHRQEHL